MPVAQPHPWQKVLKYSPMKGTKAKKVCSILEVLCFLFAHSDYRKSSIKPPPPGELFISCPFDGGGSLIETGGLFNLETTMLSVLHAELQYKVEKLKYKKF